MNFITAWRKITTEGATCRPVGSALGFYLNGESLIEVNSGPFNFMPIHLMLGREWEEAPTPSEREKSPDEKIAERDRLLEHIYKQLVYRGEHTNLTTAIAALIDLNQDR